MPKVVVFDIWGNYAHFKKIYATTSAVSYMIPTKTALYGYVGAVLGLGKNEYLSHFQNKSCLLGLRVQKPIIMQRINTNLRPSLGRLNPNDNRKPTTMEYVYEPKYRVYFMHKCSDMTEGLNERLKNRQPVYTPTLGLANLISSFEWVSTYETEPVYPIQSISIHSVVPRKKLIRFDEKSLFENSNEIVEQSLYAVEMDTERNVTERDDILLDRKANPIQTFVHDYYPIGEENVVLF